ncbi:MAG TPA: VCBS repeat-containing protein, partial [Pyrinomonadaceae bacterium]
MSKKQKRLVFYCSPLVVLLAVFVLGRAKLGEIEGNAQQLAQLGQAAQKVLGEYRAGLEKADAGKVLACFDEAYANEREGLWAEQLQSERDGVRVYEWKLQDARPYGKREVGEQVAHYLGGLGRVEESKFKLDSIERIEGPGSYVIRSFLWVRGARAARGPAETVKASAAAGARPPAEEAFESQALFRMWLRAEGNDWKITKQELIRGATVTGDRQGFTDLWGHESFASEKAGGAASSAGIDFASRFNPNFFTPAWRPKTFEIIKYGPAGVSAVDYDNDGWYDVFFADGERPRLYRNRGDGTFADVSAQAGLPDAMSGVNVGIFADFDNDGFKDAFLGCFTDRSRLFKNVADAQAPGGRRLVEVTDTSGITKKGDGDFVVVAAAGDYDNDGDLDLYAGRYLDPRKNLPTTLFYTRNGEGNSLLRNDSKDGVLRFTDVTKQAGISETGLTLGVAWGDYDADGDLDMYAANDFGRDALLRNNGDGTFSDVSKETGAFDPGYGMGSTWGDVDNDGDLDIYVSDVHSGQRWYG